MLLIVGLGNPGKKYEKTRHNIGFQVVEAFSEKNNFPGFRISKKFKSEISEGFLNKRKIILAKPQTFMNLSGKGAKLLIAFYELPITNIWVIHDDIDLPLGKIKIVKNRGAAGHRGVESIIKEFGAKNFVRFRIGIKPVSNEQRTMNNVEKFVLEKFNKKEEKTVKEAIKKTVEAIEFALKEGPEKAMSEYNK